jgi:hypothetical protein
VRNLHLAHLHPNLDYGGKKRERHRELEGKRHIDAEGSKRDLEIGGEWEGGRENECLHGEE